jgi:hypothetical protein
VKKFAFLTLIIALLLGGFGAVAPSFAADDLKPVLTVSFAGYEEVLANIETIGKLGGKPDLAKGLEGMLAIVTQGKGLSGLDKKAPWGMVLHLSEQGQPAGFGFLPVSDLKQLMDIAMNSPAGASIKENDGVYEIENPDGQTVYVAQRGKIAAIVREKADLDGVPSDPEKLLGDLPKKYLVAVRATVSNVPDALRDQALGIYNMILMSNSQQNEGESDEEFAIRTKVMERGMEQITMLVKETEQIVLGLNLDRATNKTYLDFEITAKAGSKLAEELSRAKPGKTDLAGVQLTGAAAVLNAIGTMSDKNVAEAKDTLKVVHNQILAGLAKQGLTEEQDKLVKDLLDDALSIAEKNLETKKSDVGMTLRLEPSALTLVAGTAVADGKPIEGLAKKILEAAKQEEPSLSDRVKFDAETYKGVRFHTFSIPTPEEDMKPFVGDEIDVVLGVGDKQAFVALGRDAAKVLKEVIDKSQAEPGKDTQPFQLTVSGLAIARFVAATAEDDETKGPAQQIADMLEKAEGKDHLTVTGQSVTNGMKIRFELEEGFLKMLGGASQMLGGMGTMPEEQGEKSEEPSEKPEE